MDMVMDPLMDKVILLVEVIHLGGIAVILVDIITTGCLRKNMTRWIKNLIPVSFMIELHMESMNPTILPHKALLLH